jgi:Zn-dependent protease
MAGEQDSPFGKDGLVQPSRPSQPAVPARPPVPAQAPAPGQPNPAEWWILPPTAQPPTDPAWGPTAGPMVGPTDQASVPNPAMQRRGDWRKKAGGAAGAAGIFAKILLSIKGLAFLLHFKTLGSMLISVVVYTIFFGWKFAVGFVLLLFVHEMGHVFVLRAQGVKASAPMFIPLFGAFVSVKGPQRSVAAEAVSALAGPAAGVLSAGVVMAIADFNHSPLLRALAFTAFLVNLFNLLPALPLDGGRVAGALHPAVWFVGMGAAVAFLFWRPSPVLFLILILGSFEAIRRWRERRAGQAGDYYQVPKAQRIQIGIAYVIVAVLCLAGMAATYAPAAHVWS